MKFPKLEFSARCPTVCARNFHVEPVAMHPVQPQEHECGQHLPCGQGNARGPARWKKLQKTPKKSRTYCIILHPGVEDCTWLRLSMIYKYPQDGLHNVSTCWIQNVLKAVLQKKHPKSSTNILHVPHGPPSPWSNRALCSSLALHSQGTASPPATEMAGEVSMLQISACFVWPK